MSDSGIKQPPRVLALFSGAGGLDLGFRMAGFDVGVSTDVEPLVLKTIDRNVGRYFARDHVSVSADASLVSPQDLGTGPYDFIIGGPPCQSFSAAGRRAGGVHGVNDFRGSLFWHYCRLIGHFQPRGFLFENVRGLLQANKGKDWAVIHAAFMKLGYRIVFRVLDAADYGVPQHRERLIVVGLRDTDFLFPRPFLGPDSKGQQPHLSVGDAFEDLDDPAEVVPPYGGKYGDLLKEIPPGMNYLYFTEEMGHPQPRFAWRSKFSDFLYKLDPMLPAKTIVASPGRYGGPFHWRGRRLTIAEYKRIQSFPDDYKFEGSYLAVVKQIGNSVAPRFAHALARAVMVQVFGPADDKIELLTPDQPLTFDKRKRLKADRTRGKRSATITIAPGQLTLWSQQASEQSPLVQSQFVWNYQEPRKRVESPIEGSIEFQLVTELRNNVWTVKVTEQNKALPSTLRLRLTFRPNEHRLFREIEVVLHCSSLEYAAVAWDAVDWCIGVGSSYTSIQPLYGHFTEPHPKFDLTVEACDPLNIGLQDFIVRTSKFDYVSGTRQVSDLAGFFPGRPPVESMKYLRSLGWDVRSNETNRAIPPGYFRSCYPFTVSLNEPRFVVWREKGTHETADSTTIPTPTE